MAPRKYRLPLIKTSAAVLACYTLRIDEWVLYFFLYAKYWFNIHGYLFGFSTQIDRFNILTTKKEIL